jgi:hypothetical protein
MDPLISHLVFLSSSCGSKSFSGRLIRGSLARPAAFSFNKARAEPIDRDREIAGIVGFFVVSGQLAGRYRGFGLSDSADNASRQ